MTTVATATVLRLPRKRRAPRTDAMPRAVQSTRFSTQQTAAACGVGAVALVLTGLSLTHLSAGIQLVTNSSSAEAWAMAVGVDLGFVMLELSQLCASTRKANWWAHGAIIGTVIGSALLNAFAFAHAATGWMVYPAAALGLAIPGLIYAMTRVGASIWTERN